MCVLGQKNLPPKTNFKRLLTNALNKPESGYKAKKKQEKFILSTLYYIVVSLTHRTGSAMTIVGPWRSPPRGLRPDACGMGGSGEGLLLLDPHPDWGAGSQL